MMAITNYDDDAGEDINVNDDVNDKGELKKKRLLKNNNGIQ